MIGDPSTLSVCVYSSEFLPSSGASPEWGPRRLSFHPVHLNLGYGLPADFFGPLVVYGCDVWFPHICGFSIFPPVIISSPILVVGKRKVGMAGVWMEDTRTPAWGHGGGRVFCTVTHTRARLRAHSVPGRGPQSQLGADGPQGRGTPGEGWPKSPGPLLWGGRTTRGLPGEGLVTFSLADRVPTCLVHVMPLGCGLSPSTCAGGHTPPGPSD